MVNSGLLLAVLGGRDIDGISAAGGKLLFDQFGLKPVAQSCRELLPIINGFRYFDTLKFNLDAIIQSKLAFSDFAGSDSSLRS